MSSHTFAAFITHENSSPHSITGPARVIPRDVITYSAPTEHELDDLRWGQKLTGPTKSEAVRPSTPRELESSEPSTPTQGNAVGAIIQSATNPPRNKWRLLSAAIMCTNAGIADAATGSLIPYIELEFNIGYAIVSLIFVTYAIGFLCAAPLVGLVDRRFGRSGAYIIANSLLATGYALLVAAPHFSAVVVAFYLLGFGVGVLLAMTNVWVVNLVNGTVILGFMHALYGLGGIISPIMATAMVSNGARWSHFYAITLGFSLVSLTLMGWSFRGYERDAAVQLLTALERTASRQAPAAGETSHKQLLKEALKQRTTQLGAVFILFYQGAEVAISGWIISFLINYRDGNPAKVGNVTAGFWGGIALGRIVLTPFAPKIGEKLFVVIVTAVAAGLQLLAWLVPNIIGVAVAESLVGLALGPVYPCATAVLSRLLPRNMQVTALSFVTSAGSSGGALIPLVTGLMAQRLGTVVLHPIVIFSCGVMLVSWILLPRMSKRKE